MAQALAIQISAHSASFTALPADVQVLADGLKAAVEGGKARAVGVCNYDAQHMEEMHGLLDKAGIPLACNQVRRLLMILRDVRAVRSLLSAHTRVMRRSTASKSCCSGKGLDGV